MQKIFDKIQCLFNDKNTQYSRNRRELLDMMEAIYEKPTCDIILNGEILKDFLKVGKKTRMPAFTMLIQHRTSS